jgi:hypothetical protein
LALAILNLGQETFGGHILAIAGDSMNRKILHRRIWLNCAGAISLISGLASAAVIYLRAGKGYQVMLEDSKMYRHNLEVFGGKFMVMIDDFRLWFLGLWHGKSLAVIIGCAAIMVSGGFFYAAHHLSQSGKSADRGKNYPEGSG